jgi:trigger factor
MPFFVLAEKQDSTRFGSAEMAEERNESAAPETTTEDTRTEEQKARDLRTSKNTVTLEDAGPCKKKVVIEIPEATIKDMADEQYRELRRDALVPGFRKGRAPRRLLEKRFGKETSEQLKLKILAEASETAIKAKKLDVLTDPDIDYEHVKLPESGPMKFDFEVEVRPEFELPALEGIAVTRTKLEVTDAQVDREIEQLRRWAGLWVPKEDGTVEQGNEVVADVRLNAHLTDEEKAKLAEAAEKGQEPPSTGIPESETRLDNTEVHVRPNGFVGAVPVPKLDELLVGAKVGDKKTTTVEITKTYFREEYQGRTVDVEIDIKEVKYIKPAEMDQQFLQRYHVSTEQELRDRIRDNLQAHLESQIRGDMSEQVYQYLLNNTSFDLPVDIVARQAGTILQRQYINLLARGLSREQIEEQMEQLRTGSEDQARQQLKTFFIMDTVAEKFGIDVTEEEINGHIAQVATQRGQRPERLKEQMERDGSLSQFRLDIRQNKCIGKLLETANISEQKPEEKAKKPKKGKKSAEETAGEQSQ